MSKIAQYDLTSKNLVRKSKVISDDIIYPHTGGAASAGSDPTIPFILLILGILLITSNHA